MESDELLKAMQEVQDAGIALGHKIQATFFAQAFSNQEMIETSAKEEMFNLAEATRKYDSVVDKTKPVIE